MADDPKRDTGGSNGGLGKIPPAAIIAFILFDIVVMVAIALYIFKPWAKDTPPDKEPAGAEKIESQPEPGKTGVAPVYSNSRADV